MQLLLLVRPTLSQLPALRLLITATSAVTTTVTATTVTVTVTVTATTSATATATANMAADALTTVTNTNQAAGTGRRHRNVAATITTTSTATATAAAAATGGTACVALRPRLEVRRVDELDQRLAGITELAHAMLDAIGPKVLGYQLLDTLLRHRLGDRIGVRCQLAQRSCGRNLRATRHAIAIECQIEDPLRIRVVGGGVCVVVVQLHVLVEDTVVEEVFLQQWRTIIKLSVVIRKTIAEMLITECSQ